MVSPELMQPVSGTNAARLDLNLLEKALAEARDEEKTKKTA